MNLPYFDHAPWRPEPILKTFLLRRRWTVLPASDGGLLGFFGRRLLPHPVELVIQIGELLLESVIDLDVSLLPDVLEGVDGRPVVLDHEEGDHECRRTGFAEHAVNIEESSWRVEGGDDERHRSRKVPETLVYRV